MRSLGICRMRWGLLAVALVTAAFGTLAPPARAFRSCPPDPLPMCLPGSGYTLDVSWNCGAHTSAANCYYNGVLSKAHAARHTWGWGSADFDGSGNPTVCVAAEGSTQTVWGQCAAKLVRVCAKSNCADDDNYLFLDVFHNSSGTWLVQGRGMA
jgi:hypothetical protein